jgi:hypothetical protein
VLCVSGTGTVIGETVNGNLVTPTITVILDGSPSLSSSPPCPSGDVVALITPLAPGIAPTLRLIPGVCVHL